MSETIHATCVAIGDRGVLIAGASGRGKSDLALRLIDRGAVLVSDDYSLVADEGGRLVARPPATIAGRIEVRGIGILPMAHQAQVDVALLVDLDGEPERLPEAETRVIAGVPLAVARLMAHEASAPIKVELALAGLCGA